MMRNVINFILSIIIIYFFAAFIPLLRNVYTAISVILLGVKSAEWLMKFTRKYVLYRSVCPNNKAVLITGCDSGFGNRLARRMDDVGYKVYACCLCPSGEGAMNLSQESSERLTVLPLNVTDAQSIEDVKEFVANDLKRTVLWAIVNNAGIIHFSEIDWTPIEEIQKIYDVNVTGTLRVTKAFLPFLKKSKGRIINIASMSGRIHVPVFNSYSMSKSAVIALTTGLRIELAKFGIKAISIEPSFYSTPLTTETSIVSTERIWKITSKEIKEEYGEKYLQSFKIFVKKYLKFACSPKLSEVINCIEDAITAEDPLSTYFPYSLRLFNLFLIMPTYVQEYIQIKLLDRVKKPLVLTLKSKAK